MQPIPPQLLSKFDASLHEKSIPNPVHSQYRKWLRYFLDFCGKYHFTSENKDSLPGFIEKLKDKKQSLAQQEQALNAISIYYDIGASSDGLTGRKLPIHTKSLPPVSRANESTPVPVKPDVASVQPKAKISLAYQSVESVARLPETRCERPAGYIAEPLRQTDPVSFKEIQKTGASWRLEYERLAEEILVRRYSLKTLKTYRLWTQKFQAFVRSRPPELLSTHAVKEFLTFLAVKRKVSATTQNQAFNALLFFFRHALGKEFGKVDGVVRAKRKSYIPVVLSRDEIRAVLAHLNPPYDLVVELLYGCGLRLFECLGLRVQCMVLATSVPKVIISE